LFEASSIGAIEIELFYARVYILWVRVFVGTKECFEMLPVGVGLAFEICVGVDEEVDLGVLVDFVDGHVAEGTGGESRLPAGAGEEVAAGSDCSDALSKLGGVLSELGKVSDDLVEQGEGLVSFLSSLSRLLRLPWSSTWKFSRASRTTRCT
jgi:hypothetical protein